MKKKLIILAVILGLAYGTVTLVANKKISEKTNAPVGSSIKRDANVEPGSQEDKEYIDKISQEYENNGYDTNQVQEKADIAKIREDVSKINEKIKETDIRPLEQN